MTRTPKQAAQPGDTVYRVLADLLSYAEQNVCMHENTHRGGAIWEVCDDCGAQWADDQGGKPEFEWPKAISAARAVFNEMETASVQSCGEDAANGAKESGIEKAFSSSAMSRRDDLELPGATTYLDRFVDALGLLCRSKPSKTVCKEWLSGESEELQSWAVSNARIYWQMGIGTTEAAQHLADNPEEGEDHEGFTSDYARTDLAADGATVGEANPVVTVPLLHYQDLVRKAGELRDLKTNGAIWEREAFEAWFKTAGIWNDVIAWRAWQARAALTAEKVVPTPQQISDYLHGLDEIQRAVVEREYMQQNDGGNSPDVMYEAAFAAAPAQPCGDAYAGAREDLAIWKKRALEAEALNRKFMDEINGPTHMGEPHLSCGDAEQADAPRASETARYIVIVDWEGEPPKTGAKLYAGPAQALLASKPAVPEGWKLVPATLTGGMVDAYRTYWAHTQNIYGAWSAMLAATPTAPAQPCGDAEQADAPQKLCSICHGYGRYQDGNSGTESDGYAPNIVECECAPEERFPRPAEQADEAVTGNGQ